MTGRIVAAGILVVVAAGAARADLVSVSSFDDLLYWTGSGTNEAALVLQFPTTVSSSTVAPAAIAWGYRWNGSATMEQMVFALAGGITGGPAPAAGSDPRLAFDVSDWGTLSKPEYFVNSISYAQAGLPAGWSPVTREIPEWNDPNFAALYTRAGDGSWSSGPFTLSDFGMSSITLADGDWYGFVYTDGPGTFAFSQPVAAVPEPATWTMLLGGALAAIAVARRRARRS